MKKLPLFVLPLLLSNWVALKGLLVCSAISLNDDTDDSDERNGTIDDDGDDVMVGTMMTLAMIVMVGKSMMVGKVVVKIAVRISL